MGTFAVETVVSEIDSRLGNIAARVDRALKEAEASDQFVEVLAAVELMNRYAASELLSGNPSAGTGPTSEGWSPVKNPLRRRDLPPQQMGRSASSHRSENRSCSPRDLLGRQRGIPLGSRPRPFVRYPRRPGLNRAPRRRSIDGWGNECEVDPVGLLPAGHR
jgi:hypothetical protein